QINGAATSTGTITDYDVYLLIFGVSRLTTTYSSDAVSNANLAGLCARTQSISVGSAEAQAGDSLSFNVTMSTAVATATVISFKTIDGSAKEGQDYTARAGNLTIPAGETSGT